MGQESVERLTALYVEGWNAIQMAINKKEGHACGGIKKIGERNKERKRIVFLKNKWSSASPRNEINNNLSFPTKFLSSIIILANPIPLVIKS